MLVVLMFGDGGCREVRRLGCAAEQKRTRMPAEGGKPHPLFV